MKKISIAIFRSFQTKVTLYLILSMLFIGIVSNLAILRFALNSQFNDLRNKLMIIAQTAALMVDARALMQVPLSRQGEETAQFKAIAQDLTKIKKANPAIKYIYTLTKTEKEGIWQFVVDPSLTSHPGDEYDVSRFPEMAAGLNSPSADRKLESDEWGVTLSGYAPVRDANGKSVAVLGVDVSAEQVYLLQREVLRRQLIVFAIGVLFSIILGFALSRKISGPIKRLVEGTQYIAKGNLQYKIEIEGIDEISRLAGAFNRMSASLYESRQKLLNYFQRLMQSFVRILEAKDHYTRGHSERVAEYSVRIARKLGMPMEKVELLREAALLHDIGKLGIEDRILNKKEKLSQEEREIIFKHPVIGEEILKPVSENSEMLAVVRGHHERYDGKGYPDKISGEDIDILAAIASVADTFDAMTTTRAYRQALSKEAAIEELKKNKGRQFKTEIVDAFIKALEEPQ